MGSKWENLISIFIFTYGKRPLKIGDIVLMEKRKQYNFLIKNFLFCFVKFSWYNELKFFYGCLFNSLGVLKNDIVDIKGQKINPLLGKRRNTMEKNLSKYLPFGSKLFFLVHVMLGMGFPVAEHSNRTGEPFFTCKCPPDETWSIVGGTANKINEICVELIKRRWCVA